MIKRILDHLDRQRQVAGRRCRRARPPQGELEFAQASGPARLGDEVGIIQPARRTRTENRELLNRPGARPDSRPVGEVRRGRRGNLALGTAERRLDQLADNWRAAVRFTGDSHAKARAKCAGIERARALRHVGEGFEKRGLVDL